MSFIAVFLLHRWLCDAYLAVDGICKYFDPESDPQSHAALAMKVYAKFAFRMLVEGPMEPRSAENLYIKNRIFVTKGADVVTFLASAILSVLYLFINQCIRKPRVELLAERWRAELAQFHSEDYCLIKHAVRTRSLKVWL